MCVCVCVHGVVDEHVSEFITVQAGIVVVGDCVFVYAVVCRWFAAHWLAVVELDGASWSVV